MKAHWLVGLASWIVAGAIAGGTLTARLVDAVAGEPAKALVAPTPRPTPTYVPTATIVPTATLVPTPRPTISTSPLPKAAASEFALHRS